MVATVVRDDLLTRLDDSAARVRELAAGGALPAAELVRLADMRAIAAFRLEPRPTDPVRQVREGYAAMRERLARLAQHDPARPAVLISEDGFVYTFRPRTVLRRTLDHALDHLNQIEQWMTWRNEGVVPTPTDGWASSGDQLDEDALPLSEADLAAWLWRIDLIWSMLAERAERLSQAELDWFPPDEEWNTRRVLEHVSGGFYTAWLDDPLPDDPASRYAVAGQRLRERVQQALATPPDPDETYANGSSIAFYAQWSQRTTPETIVDGVLDVERAATAAHSR